MTEEYSPDVPHGGTPTDEGGAASGSLFGEGELAAETRPAAFDATQPIEATDGTKATPMPGDKPAKAKASDGPTVQGGDLLPVYARKRVWIVRGSTVAELKPVAGKVAKVTAGTSDGVAEGSVSIRLDDEDDAGESVVLDRKPGRVYSTELAALAAAAGEIRRNVDKLLDALSATLLRVSCVK